MGEISKQYNYEINDFSPLESSLAFSVIDVMDIAASNTVDLAPTTTTDSNKNDIIDTNNNNYDKNNSVPGVTKLRKQNSQEGKHGYLNESEKKLLNRRDWKTKLAIPSELMEKTDHRVLICVAKDEEDI